MISTVSDGAISAQVVRDSIADNASQEGNLFAGLLVAMQQGLPMMMTPFAPAAASGDTTTPAVEGGSVGTVSGIESTNAARAATAAGASVVASTALNQAAGISQLITLPEVGQPVADSPNQAAGVSELITLPGIGQPVADSSMIPTSQAPGRQVQGQPAESIANLIQTLNASGRPPLSDHPRTVVTETAAAPQAPTERLVRLADALRPGSTGPVPSGDLQAAPASVSRVVNQLVRTEALLATTQSPAAVAGQQVTAVSPETLSLPLGPLTPAATQVPTSPALTTPAGRTNDTPEGRLPEIVWEPRPAQQGATPVVPPFAAQDVQRLVMATTPPSGAVAVAADASLEGPLAQQETPTPTLAASQTAQPADAVAVAKILDTSAVTVAASAPLEAAQAPRFSEQVAAAAQPAVIQATADRLVRAVTELASRGSWAPAESETDAPGVASSTGSNAEQFSALLQSLGTGDRPPAIEDNRPVEAAQKTSLVTNAAEPDLEVRQLRLELSPAHLGAVTLEIRSQGQHVTALVVVDHDEARQVVQRTEDQVRQLLSEQGLQVAGFDVSCRDQSQREHLPAPAPIAGPSLPETQERAAVSPRREASTAVTAVDIYA